MKSDISPEFYNYFVVPTGGTRKGKPTYRIIRMPLGCAPSADGTYAAETYLSYSWAPCTNRSRPTLGTGQAFTREAKESRLAELVLDETRAEMNAYVTAWDARATALRK